MGLDRHEVSFGADTIVCRLETAASLAGGALHKPWQTYWVAEWKEKRVLIAPAEAFDLTNPDQEAAFRQLVLERLGLLR